MKNLEERQCSQDLVCKDASCIVTISSRLLIELIHVQYSATRIHKQIFVCCTDWSKNTEEVNRSIWKCGLAQNWVTHPLLNIENDMTHPFCYLHFRFIP